MNTCPLQCLNCLELWDNRWEGVGDDGEDDDEGEEQDEDGRHDQLHVPPGHTPLLLILGSLKIVVLTNWALVQSEWLLTCYSYLCCYFDLGFRICFRAAMDLEKNYMCLLYDIESMFDFNYILPLPDYCCDCNAASVAHLTLWWLNAYFLIFRCGSISRSIFLSN